MPKNKSPQPRESKARSYARRKAGGEPGKMFPVLNRNALKRNNTPETSLFLYDLKQ